MGVPVHAGYGLHCWFRCSSMVDRDFQMDAILSFHNLSTASSLGSLRPPPASAFAIRICSTAFYRFRSFRILPTVLRVETCFRDNGADPAEKIRQAVSRDGDSTAPGILVVSVKDSVEFDDRLNLSIPAEQGNLPQLLDSLLLADHASNLLDGWAPH